MKTIKLSIIALLLFAVSSTQAQVAVDLDVSTPNVNVHVGTNSAPSRPVPPPSRPAPPPVWGPVGSDEVEYYYLPDIEVYYDIRQAQYIYFGNGRWIHSRYLPHYCRNYDLQHGYKVVLADYHGRSPYSHFDAHRAKYYKGYKGAPQQSRGQYKVRYEDHDRHDNDNHNYGYQNRHENQNNHGNDDHYRNNDRQRNDDHHGKHEGKGHNGKEKH
jgi:hypothetical protein